MSMKFKSKLNNNRNGTEGISMLFEYTNSCPKYVIQNAKTFQATVHNFMPSADLALLNSVISTLCNVRVHQPGIPLIPFVCFDAFVVTKGIFKAICFKDRFVCPSSFEGAIYPNNISCLDTNPYLVF